MLFNGEGARFDGDAVLACEVGDHIITGRVWQGHRRRVCIIGVGIDLPSLPALCINLANAKVISIVIRAIPPDDQRAASRRRICGEDLYVIEPSALRDLGRRSM